MKNLQDKPIGYQLNPAYYFGGLTFLFLVIQLFSGVFLMMNFIPTLQKAYPSLVFITNTLPYGVFIRTGHRYAAFFMLFLCILHLVRMWVTDKFTYPRNIGWITGVALLFITVAIIMSGFVTSYDSTYQAVIAQLAKMLNIQRRDMQSFFAIFYSIHLFLPTSIFLVLIVHFSRLARPKILPPLSLTFLSMGLLTILSALIPIKQIPVTPIKGVLVTSQLSISFIVIGVLVLVSILLCFVPFVYKRKRVLAKVDNARCTGCLYCADVCPKKAIEDKQVKVLGKLKKVAFVMNKKCQGCGICVGACRSSVIALEGSDDSKILEEVNVYA
jgi:quinol-cytochrome oxidoreductase complex cytochrome b subunit/NAD-dependent dihydropyrimidine dehydrogenase PreA subunit